MDLLSDFDAPDPVSEVLRAVRIRSTVYCRSVLAAPWGFGVTGHGNPAFHVVTTGTCWLEVDGGPDQAHLPPETSSCCRPGGGIGCATIQPPGNRARGAPRRHATRRKPPAALRR